MTEECVDSREIERIKKRPVRGRLICLGERIPVPGKTESIASKNPLRESVVRELVIRARDWCGVISKEECREQADDDREDEYCDQVL